MSVGSREYNAATDLLDRNIIEGRAGKAVYIDDRGTCTYTELVARANRAGNALLSLGVAPEQRVMLAMLDTIDFPTMFLGAIKAGIVPVPVNTLLTADDYVFLLRDSRARVLVVSDALLPKLDKAISEVSGVIVLVASSPLGGPASHHRLLADVLATASEALEPARTTPDDVAFWLYSSGSTGKPKGAVHLHSHLMVTADLYARAVLGIRENDVVYSAAKLFFAYGLGNALTFPLAVGATAVLSAERVTPTVVSRVMREHSPTIFCGVPTLFAALLADASFAVSSALRVSTSAGEALPAHVGTRWHERFGSHILDGIGSTEMLHIFLSNRPDDIRYGTSGKAVAGYELKVVGDDGELAAAGEEGVLWVHGPTACAGYWNDRERSLATFHGPWTRTGDRYVRDEAGYYTYSGRADDMLKVGGIWVSPFEVESALTSHDAVLEAAVIGDADGDGLIKPKAFVVLKDPKLASEALSAELKAHVKAKLAPYKYPRWVEFIAEVPKTATGKIQRFKLRG
jgi:benzoate-CoA ligase